ncbi:hypothetical protein P4B35_08635 [Pontiellaceae bacterium B12227]|nr:hypothetical protein [Pontiellaceae bacterium B12227]
MKRKVTVAKMVAILKEAGYSTSLVECMSSKQIEQQVSSLDRTTKRCMRTAINKTNKKHVTRTKAAFGAEVSFISKAISVIRKAWDDAQQEVDAEALKNRIEFLNNNAEAK